MTNEKIILQLEKGYDIKNPQLAQVLTNIENNGVTKEEFTEAMGTKADLVGGKVPAEQLPSYVDDVINFWDITTGVNPISTIINNVNYTNRMWFITKSTSSESIGIKYPNKFIDFGANTSEDDWTIIEPEEGKIYIKIGSGNDQNHSFRWSGIALIDLDKHLTNQIIVLGTKTVTETVKKKTVEKIVTDYDIIIFRKISVIKPIPVTQYAISHSVSSIIK